MLKLPAALPAVVGVPSADAPFAVLPGICRGSHWESWSMGLSLQTGQWRYFPPQAIFPRPRQARPIQPHCRHLILAQWALTHPQNRMVPQGLSHLNKALPPSLKRTASGLAFHNRS